MTLRFASLFAGIGGFDLGFERAGMECAWQCEIDSYCINVLEKHWPDVKRYGDIYEIDCASIENIDLICGGFPCQPFSSASHGRIVAVDLWPEMSRIIEGIKPTWVIAENVSRKAILNAKKDVEKLGYYAQIRSVSAAQAGADHTRNRWWLFAHADNESKLHSVVNGKVAMLQALCADIWGKTNYTRAIRIPDGLPNRVDRLRCLGNAIIPQIAEWIGRQIMQADKISS